MITVTWERIHSRGAYDARVDLEVAEDDIPPYRVEVHLIRNRETRQWKVTHMRNHSRVELPRQKQADWDVLCYFAIESLK